MWGYDAAFMALCEPSLTVHPDDIADGRVLVSDGSDGRPAGIAAVSKPGPDGRCELTLIFVEPGEVGCGHGSRLFEELTSIARSRGGKVLEVLADPHAMAFYRRMGCRVTGDAPSDAIPGRRLPTLEFDLVQAGGAEE